MKVMIITVNHPSISYFHHFFLCTGHFLVDQTHPYTRSVLIFVLPCICVFNSCLCNISVCPAAFESCTTLQMLRAPQRGKLSAQINARFPNGPKHNFVFFSVLHSKSAALAIRIKCMISYLFVVTLFATLWRIDFAAVSIANCLLIT